MTEELPKTIGETLGVIRERIRKLEEWLAAHGGDCDTEQAHLDDGRERNYWHYGYLTALRDTLKMLDARPAH
jgi:hypothetical protein